MERYLEYEGIKERYESFQELFAKILLEKERLMTKTLPNAITYDGLKVQSSVDGNPLEEYVLSVEDEGLDLKLKQYRQSLIDWKMLLDLKERELRQSPLVIDKIYVYRFLDGYSVSRICRSLNYGRAWVYRKISQIEKRRDKSRQKV